MVDDGKVGPVAPIAEGSEQESDLFAGENIRKRFVATALDLLPDVPIQAEVITVESAQRANRLVDGASFKFAVLLEMERKVQDSGFAQARDLRLGVVVGELDDPAEVGVYRLLAPTFELDSALVVLIPFR